MITYDEEIGSMWDTYSEERKITFDLRKQMNFSKDKLRWTSYGRRLPLSPNSGKLHPSQDNTQFLLWIHYLTATKFSYGLCKLRSACRILFELWESSLPHYKPTRTLASLHRFKNLELHGILLERGTILLKIRLIAKASYTYQRMTRCRMLLKVPVSSWSARSF